MTGTIHDEISCEFLKMLKTLLNNSLYVTFDKENISRKQNVDCHKHCNTKKQTKDFVLRNTTYRNYRITDSNEICSEKTKLHT